MTQQSCSLLAADEPLAATAPQALMWTLIEHEGPWAAKAVADAGIASTKEHTTLFVRQHSRPGRSRVWQYDGSRFTVTEDGVTSDVTHPMLFVCTNGKRDTCCAVNGLPIVRDFDNDQVLESTHLGGHRFAATALLLPHNIVLGRLTHSAAASALAGVIPLEHYRGMSHMTRAQQAADIAVRRQFDITEPSPLAVASISNSDEAFHVSLGGRAWDVQVWSKPSIQRPESCGGDMLQALAYEATSVQPCTHGDAHH